MKIMRLSMRWKAISERDDLPQTDHLRFGVIVTDEGTRRNIVWTEIYRDIMRMVPKSIAADRQCIKKTLRRSQCLFSVLLLLRFQCRFLKLRAAFDVCLLHRVVIIENDQIAVIAGLDLSEMIIESQ